MRNLLTKTLFISLLLSAVIPSDVQAGFSIAGGKQFSKVALGASKGAAIAAVATRVAVMAEAVTAEAVTVGQAERIAMTVLLAARRVVVGKAGKIAAVGAMVGAARAGGEIIKVVGAGIGAGVGAMAGEPTGMLVGKIISGKIKDSSSKACGYCG